MVRILQSLAWQSFWQVTNQVFGPGGMPRALYQWQREITQIRRPLQQPWWICCQVALAMCNVPYLHQQSGMCHLICNIDNRKTIALQFFVKLYQLPLVEGYLQPLTSVKSLTLINSIWVYWQNCNRKKEDGVFVIKHAVSNNFLILVWLLSVPFLHTHHCKHLCTQSDSAIRCTFKVTY